MLPDMVAADLEPATRRLAFVLQHTADTRARAVIVDRLDRFNEAQTGLAHSTPLDVVIRDERGGVLGGLVGRTSLGVFFVDYLFVPEQLRGQGHGARALELAEAEAVRRGCATALLFTMVIQAPAFYERCGYAAFARIECEPAGNARIFMRKALAPR